VTIQVKTLSKKTDVSLGSTDVDSSANLMADYWVIVNNIDDIRINDQETSEKVPPAYILSRSEVEEKASYDVKDGKKSHWLQHKYYKDEKYLNKWDKITALPR
jgi:hypothetical protein